MMRQCARRVAPILAIISAGLCLAWSSPALSQTAKPVPTAPANKPDHKGACAHDPRFDDKALWPKLSGKEYFLKEQWPKARLLVWAHPGQSGNIKNSRGVLDATDPQNWLEDGKPCTKLVLDENTDLLFPASEKPYRVGFRGTDVREVCRHVTIESGAGFCGGGDGVGRSIFGNVWVKAGGGMDSQGATRFLGGKHTFFRNDNTKETVKSMGRGDGIMCSQYFTFGKTDNASVEFLGHVTVLDEFKIHGCTVIVGPDSILQPGRNAAPAMQQGGVLALMDGATFESWNNDFGTPEMTVQEGTIQGGLPERPLSRSCKYGLAFKNYTNAQYADASDKVKQRQLGRVPGLVMFAGAIKSYTQAPDKARLVFSVMQNEEACPRPGTDRYEADIKRDPGNKGLYDWMITLPRGIDCFLGKDVIVDTVEFDHLRKGGLMCEDPAVSKKWKNVFFGPNCHSQDIAQFVSQVAKPARGVHY